MPEEDNHERIAQEAARRGARHYYDDEIYREKPLAFTYVANTIAGDIGTVLFYAGHDYNTLTYDQRREIAIQALREVGYPEVR